MSPHVSRHVAIDVRHEGPATARKMVRETAEIMLKIDIDKLAKILGQKCIRNTSGKTTLLFGCVKAHILRTSTEEVK